MMIFARRQIIDAFVFDEKRNYGRKKVLQGYSTSVRVDLSLSILDTGNTKYEPLRSQLDAWF